MAGQDDARAEETDAGDDLGCHTRGVVAGNSIDQDVGEAVLGNEHHEARCQAHDGLGANTGALSPDLPFEADGGRQDESEQHPPDADELVRHGVFLRRRRENFSLATRNCAGVWATRGRGIFRSLGSSGGCNGCVS